MNTVELALKLDAVLEKADCDEETRRHAIEFVWFVHSGHLIDWSLVRIPKDAYKRLVAR